MKGTAVEKGCVSPFGIDETKYSSLCKLLRITVLCLKFVKKRVFNRCSQSLQEKVLQKCTILKRVITEIKEQSLYFSKIRAATLLWLYVIQRRQFCDVFTAIRKGI